jgi:M6 family metalloprotease-like protein
VRATASSLDTNEPPVCSSLVLQLHLAVLVTASKMRTSSTALGMSLSLALLPHVTAEDPFAPIDPQNWRNPADLTWDDFKAPPGTQWNDPERKGSERNFNIALVTLDYDNEPFVITLAPNSTVFGNPQPGYGNVAQEDVPAFYHDLLNKPTDINMGHTLHEYWMADSQGRFGVDLTAFGVYRMPGQSWQYGVDDWMNPEACPQPDACNLDLRTDGLGAWRADVGDEVADSFELVFILSAGQDESGTWQEFGEMMFQTDEDVPDAFGPPANSSIPNFAKTRYVDWTSWASASTIWPNAGGGSSTQAESSGMAVFAHELSHLLSIGDNYNNPYSVPRRRDYTGSWSMMSRGSFNGPGGPHTRWHIPALQGASMGSLHTVRDKYQLGLIPNETLLIVPSTGSNSLAENGLVIAHLTARSVESELMGLRIAFGTDQSPACDVDEDPFCDGGGYNNYDLEVIDRMSSDSFQPDAGVMISKSKDSDAEQPFQWTIDANPEDIALIDFVRPNGSDAMVSIGDYRQLADALFHAGTRSGSEFEYVDEANGLHFYVLDIFRDELGVLSYDVAARSLSGPDTGEWAVQLDAGKPAQNSTGSPTNGGIFCTFDLTNNGTFGARAGQLDLGQQAALDYFFQADIYRLSASVEASGWRVELPNALAVADYGKTVSVKVAVGAEADADDEAVVTLVATSESDADATASADCIVKKN